MKISKNFRWVFAILVLVIATGMVRMTLENVVFLPVVMKDATITPTATSTATATATATSTATATPTRTPTRTPTPSYMMIIEIVNSKTGDPLNEYVSIKNFSSRVVGLTGWFIRDDGPNRYDFPNGFSVASGKTIRLWSKDGVNTTDDLYWDSEVEVWNDARDCAYLRDDSQGEKELIDIFCYETAADGTIVIIRNPTE